MTKSPRKVAVIGGKVLDPNGELDRPPVADILIEDGAIVAIEKPATRPTDGFEVIDARGMLVTPGFVNAHYHSHDVLLRGRFEQLPLDVWGLYSFPSSYARRSADEVRIRTALGAVENLLAGVTTLQDMITIVNRDREQTDALLSAYAETGIRAVIALQVADRATADTAPFWQEDLSETTLAQLPKAIDPQPLQAFVADMLRVALPSRITWGLGPSAPQRCSEELLRWVAATAEAHGLPVFTHVYETKSQAVLAREAYAADACSLITFLERMGLLSPRLTIAHGVWITEAEIEALGKAGANLACNPISNLKLLNGIAPVRTYAKSSVGIALGCDNCSGNDAQNIFESMKMFALYWGLQGPAGESGAAAQAFRAATTGGARAMGLEDRIGSIRPGYRADLLLLDLADSAFVPLNSAVRQLVYAGTPRVVRTVLVDGKIVMRDGRIVTVDERALAAAAAGIHAHLDGEIDTVVTRMQPLAREILKAGDRIADYPLGIDRLRF